VELRGVASRERGAVLSKAGAPRESADGRGAVCYVRRSMARALVGGLLGLAALAYAGAALAQSPPRVTTGPFTGARAGAVRSAIDEAVRGHAGAVDAVPAAGYSAEAQRLGLDGLAGDQDVAQVGRALRADCVIVGELSRQGRGYLLRLRVLNGQDGTTLGTASWEVRNAEEVASLGDEIWTQLSAYVHRVSPAQAPASPTTGAPNAARAAEPDPVARRVPELAPGLGWLYLNLSGGVSMRFWQVTVLSEPTPRGYDNGGYGELRGSVAAFYRFARDRAGVGLSAGGGLPVAIQSHGYAADGTPVDVPTHAYDVWGGIAGALRPATGGAFGMAVGIAAQSFTLDTRALPPAQQQVPMNYLGLRTAIDGALPLYADPTWEFDVLFGAELRVTNVGNEARDAFGGQPGTTFGLGGTAGLGVELHRYAPGLSFRLTGELLRYRTIFSGVAHLGPASDSIDDFVRIQLGVGYAFGVAPLPARPSAAASTAAAPR
jgi:hypothetical protein